VRLAAITLCVASQRVLIAVRKLLDTTSYTSYCGQSSAQCSYNDATIVRLLYGIMEVNITQNFVDS
jgi:hypothetical protein